MIFASCQFEVWNFVLTLILGSGSLLAIVSIYIKANQDRKLFLFSKVFSDSILEIKSFYRDLVNVESGLFEYLSTPEPKDPEKLKDWKSKTVYTFEKFIQKFKENEIIFKDEELKIINELLEFIEEAKKIHSLVEQLKDSKGDNTHKESILEKEDLKMSINTRFLNLKNDLKVLFQKRYKLIF